MHILNGQNIYGFKNLFTHLDKGCRNAHPFLGFRQKNFRKILSLYLFPLGRAKLSGVFEKFFVLQKIPSLIWNWKVKTHPIFKKKFWKKTKKYARHYWQAYFLYLKSCLFHINLQKSLILDEY